MHFPKPYEISSLDQTGFLLSCLTFVFVSIVFFCSTSVFLKALLVQQVKKMLGLAKKYCKSQIKSVLSLQEVKKAISCNGQKVDIYEQEKKKGK